MIRFGQGRVRELAAAVEQYVEFHPGLAAWRAGLPLAYLAAGRDGTRGRARTGYRRARRDARGLLLARDGDPARRGERELAHIESAGVLYDTLAPYAGCMAQVGYAGTVAPV